MDESKACGFIALVGLLAFVGLAGCESNSLHGRQTAQLRGATALKASKEDFASLGLGLMDKEAIGQVRIGMLSDGVVKILGTPDSKSQAGISEVDAKPHQQWTYAKQGVVLDMISQSGRQTVDMITVDAPSELKTKRGIGIGSTKDSVLGAYSAEIDSSSEDPQTLVAGTVYGGLIFSLKDGRVSKMVLGAVAE